MSCSRRGAHASILGMAVLAISGSGARSSPPLPVGEWPTPNRTFRVATRAAFARRYTQAVGGDLILVGNGVDLGSFIFDRNGDNAQQPIIVAAADRAPGPASAFFSGRAEVPGRFNLLWGLRAMGQQMAVTGEGSVLRRILFQGARIKRGTVHPHQVSINGRGIRVEYCEIADSDARGIGLLSNCRQVRILHCYFHDFTQADTNQVYEPLQLGVGAGDYLGIPNAAEGNEVGWCYFFNINQQNTENENPSIKLPWTWVHDVHCHQARNVTCRFTHDTVLERIRITKSGFIAIQGARNTARNCWVETRTGIRTFRGSWDSSSPGEPVGSNIPNSLDTQIVNCRGNIEIGALVQGNETIRSQGTRIRSHRGGYAGAAWTITNRQGGEQEWLIEEAPEIPAETPPSYGPLSQGLLADLA